MAKDGEPRQLERRGDKTMRTGRARAPLSDRSPYRVSSMSALIAFESAARHGSFSHAARELGTSQSAISRLIARLEDELS
ncbi:MAG: LysR family transcriptional regulator, partial [Chloroflexi bacterium]|nr:LysR family transcriptional regulator [Chloroflexota bacterium]